MAKQEGASSGGLSADGDHYTVEEVTYERGTVDFGDRSGLVEGNVTAGGVISAVEVSW